VVERSKKIAIVGLREAGEYYPVDSLGPQVALHRPAAQQQAMIEITFTG
jgi:hypothetical protein